VQLNAYKVKVMLAEPKTKRARPELNLGLFGMGPLGLQGLGLDPTGEQQLITAVCVCVCVAAHSWLYVCGGCVEVGESGWKLVAVVRVSVCVNRELLISVWGWGWGGVGWGGGGGGMQVGSFGRIAPDSCLVCKLALPRLVGMQPLGCLQGLVSGPRGTWCVVWARVCVWGC
jgi:hypothetical protein